MKYRFRAIVQIRYSTGPPIQGPVNVIASNYCDAEDKTIAKIKTSYPKSGFNLLKITKGNPYPPGGGINTPRIVSNDAELKTIIHSTKTYKCSDLEQLRNDLADAKNRVDQLTVQYKKLVSLGLNQSAISQTKAELEDATKEYLYYLDIVNKLMKKCNVTTLKGNLARFS